MKPPELAPQGIPKKLLQEARIAWQRRDFTRCAEMLHRVSRKLPGDVDILLWLGGVLGLLYDYGAADSTFEKACHAAPPDGKAAALLGAAQQAQNFFNPEIAERYFRRAVAESDATSEMFVAMADFCERRRRFEDAESFVDQALQIDDGCNIAYLARARLLRRSGKLDEAERELRRLIDQTTITDILIRAGSELGVVLDRQCRYDEAMAALVEAKTMLRPATESQIAPQEFHRKQLAQMRMQISSGLMDRWSESGRDLQPQRRLAVLGGHAKSGASMLEQVLDSHSEVVSIGQTTVFSDYVFGPLKRRWPADAPILKVLDETPKELLKAYRDRYFRAVELCVGSPVGDRVLIDKNPPLTVMAPALFRVFPETKFLIAIRDPRDVVLSCFMQPVLSVKQANYRYLSIETTADTYAGLMRTWQAVSPLLPNSHLEIRHENLIEDLPYVAQQVLKFLGLPWDEALLNSEQHTQGKSARSLGHPDMDEDASDLAPGRWRNYQKHLEPHLHILEPFIKAFGYE